VVELDGRHEDDFDAVDAYVAQHGVALDVADEAMATDEVVFGRMMVHPSVPAEELARLAPGMTPAKLAGAVQPLGSGELAMAMSKVQAWRLPDRDRRTRGEVLLIGAVHGHGRVAAEADTPWSAALLVSSYAARGLRCRVVAGASRPTPADPRDPEALRLAIRRVVLARAIGAWGVAAARAGEAEPRAVAEELVAALLQLDPRPFAAQDEPAADGVPAGPDDGLGNDAEGLRRRAAIVAEAGRPQLAGTFHRAAELQAFDDAELDRLCTTLRPARAGVDALREEAEGLEARGAAACANLFREAATAYERLGLTVERP
jgi:hypothetical protein